VTWLRRWRQLCSDAAEGSAPGWHLLWRTFGGTTALVVLANLAGMAVVGLLVVALNADATDHQRLVVAVVGGTYGFLAICAGTLIALYKHLHTMRWLARGRTPTRDEARRVLRHPLDLALVTGALWLLGAAVLAVVAALVDAAGEQILDLSSGLVLAGLTTAGATYSIVVAVGRPIAIIALSVYPPAEATLFTVRARLLLTWLLPTGIPVLGIVLILSSSSGRTHIVGAGLIAAVTALVLGLIAANWSARSIGGPLHTVVTTLQRIGKGDLAAGVEVDEIGEIGMLQRGVNEMLAGLHERARIQDLFGRHVGPAVADEAIHGELSLGGGEERTVVALFVDITGSTALTRTTEPNEFIAVLNRFFGRVVAAVEANGGLVNKFEGDAALCVFGAPVRLDDAAGAALRAARAIRDRVYEDGEVEVGIGVALGPVIAGRIGAASRFEYTIVGDAVNEAARLTELAKQIDGRILASEATLSSADPSERQHWRKGRALRLRGRAMPTHTYQAAAPVSAR
jgi:class 3 adenylate cyclase